MDIDYQVLHDAFFKFQVKPNMTAFGDVYSEGKEMDAKLRLKRPGRLSDELRKALGLFTNLFSPLVICHVPLPVQLLTLP